VNLGGRGKTSRKLIISVRSFSSRQTTIRPFQTALHSAYFIAYGLRDTVGGQGFVVYLQAVTCPYTRIVDTANDEVDVISITEISKAN
jgi:hypothetical protein